MKLFILSFCAAAVLASENVPGGAPGAAGGVDHNWQEVERVKHGHLMLEATEEQMQHLGDHLGKNGLAFGGFFAEGATDLMEDFKALADEQESFHFHEGVDMSHKKWNFRISTKPEIATKMGWCHNGAHKPDAKNMKEEDKTKDFSSKPYKSCIVMLKSGVENDMVMSHEVFDKDKEALLKEIKEHVARNMAETADDAVYESETL